MVGMESWQYCSVRAELEYGNRYYEAAWDWLTLETLPLMHSHVKCEEGKQQKEGVYSFHSGEQGSVSENHHSWVEGGHLDYERDS